MSFITTTKGLKAMNKQDSDIGYEPKKTRGLFYFGAIAIAMGAVLAVGCNPSDPGDDEDPGDGGGDVVEQPPIDVTGTQLYCDPNVVIPTSTDAAGLVVETPDSIQSINVSRDAVDQSELNPNAGNNQKRLSAVVDPQTPDGTIIEVLDRTDTATQVHPILISYAEQVIGDYELGDGSADIGDPTNVDDVFTSLSLDNGATWKKVKVGDTADKSSIQVDWDTPNLDYPGHSHKPTMGVHGNNIMVAWLDKYCPSGQPDFVNPVIDDQGTLKYEVLDATTGEFEDYYKVNGSQGSIDYGGVVAPNGKIIYEVPFSCVWTARGVFGDPEGDGTYAIEWRQAQQLTSGTRDANKIWIAAETVKDDSGAITDGGFAIAWQEDTEGLRAGKGAGPGDGYSGATTNHGSDIWYTYIPMNDYTLVCADGDTECDIANATSDPVAIAAYTTKPKPAVPFTYPVRVSNNETCSPLDTKLYCEDYCDSTVTLETGNDAGDTITRCVVEDDLDYMTPDASIAPEAVVLNGDTGASRPALKILRTNENELISILAYEETKGLSESDPQDQDQGTSDTNIALEGKSVYFESFFWNQPVEVSAGDIVNLRVPEATVADDGTYSLTGLDIYENARRVVIMNQVDPCDAGTYTFGLLYKQGYETQGGPSDMFIRMNTGFTFDEFEGDENDPTLGATNISAHDVEDDGTLIWTTDWLAYQSYENAIDNTFSPRGWLRGNDIFTGFEYTPNWDQTSQGNVPNNFWMHAYLDGAWQGPKQLTLITGPKTSTLDPRFVPTPKGSNSGILTDQSNPEVLFMSYGTFDMDTGLELDLFYTRSTDRGATWEYIDGAGEVIVIDAGADAVPGTADDSIPDAATRNAKLASRDAVEEKEVQAMGSPDGTMIFNAWMQETHTYTGDPWSGLESRHGVVHYDTPAP